LTIEINWRHQIVAGRRFLFLKLSHFAAKAVDDDALEPILATEHVVVLPLHARLPDLISRSKIQELRSRELRLGNFTDVAQSVCRQFSACVTPSRLQFD